MMEWELRFKLRGHQDIGWTVSAQETYDDFQWTYRFVAEPGYSRGYLVSFFHAESTDMALFRARGRIADAWRFNIGRQFIRLVGCERVSGGIYVG